MLMQILVHTPRWVFAVFALLLALGLSQLAGRRVSLRGVSVLPLVMAAWSLWGTLSAFAQQPWVLLAWLAALVATGTTVLARPLPAGTAYDPASRRFALPGSAWPLVLMMGIFCTKFAAGVAFAQQPALALDAGFGWAVSALFGALSGIFLGRAARLWRLALPTLGAAPAIA